MRFLLTSFFLVFSWCLVAQEQGVVEGNCVDKSGKKLENVKVSWNNIVSYSDSVGHFEIVLPAQPKLLLSFVYDSLLVTKQVAVSPNQPTQLGKVKLPVTVMNSVQLKTDRGDNNILKLPGLDLQKIASNSVERTLIYTTAASSNNELTSNYNVRGGSYDENLVYVNGFLINRPFLTRSGQQEGLSFLYSSLVKDIRFSGGGFDARYGDKLSSVLDITYLTPDSTNASVMMSLLGVESHVAQKVNAKFNYLVGARYRANGYLLNALPTQGSYNPVFYDAQFLTNYALTSKLTWSVIGHLSSNNYRFAPTTQETDFGTVNQAYRLKIYFDGQEQTKFETMTGGTALKYKASEKTQLDVYASVFHTNEKEYFDVQGQYYINLLETNPAKKNFGDSIASIGVGSYLNHARNNLQATILNLYHNGSHQISEKQRVLWGVNYQRDVFNDVLSEWKSVDSAGYTITKNPSSDLNLSYAIKSKLALNSQRVSGFLQHAYEWGKGKKNYPVEVHTLLRDSLGNKIRITIRDTVASSYKKFILTSGVRAGYTEVNNEHYVTPRVSLTFFPRTYFFHNGKIMRRNTQVRFATGLYYQPPFYREFRTMQGDLNLQVVSQKSLHIISGYDFNFSMWGRSMPFKFSAEAYYKYFWDVNPYQIDNVRTRYFANNDAVAYAYGADVNIHGEFIEGVQSFFKVGYLKTMENLLHDSYTIYRNKNKETIIPGYTIDDKKADSTVVHPGFIPRPTDQRINFAILFQDKMPNYEMLTAQMGLNFGSSLPYGPPDFNRYKDTLRQKFYARVDLGLSYDLLQKTHAMKQKTKHGFSDAIVSFEVFNLMGINNILSHQWVQDVSGKSYAVPNYLTQRRFNLKLILRM
jgi:hypothetical protein